ncbi:rhodanese-like domain-containing protein [Hyphobacterium sp. CCMP332]|nr:rhodanese-like domain-containing protein [Hyphobacterium sp. CCMP332]
MLNTLLSNSVEQIDVEVLSKKIDKEDLIILDAREKNEFEVSHIQGAKYVGYDNFRKSAIMDMDKDKEVIVYCSVGYRSEKIGEKLEKMGFQNVKNLRGGIFEWKNKGFPVVNNQGDSTNKVHAFNKNWGIWLQNGEKIYD